MDEWLDIAWNWIVDGFIRIGTMLDYLLAPLNHRLGPAMVIFIIVVLLVAITKLLGKVHTTKRYVELKKDYEYWYELRQEAMACEDREKGKALARNIDQAKLNKAYYDYFFEGFLKSIITSILPVLFAAAYITSSYTPEIMTQFSGQEYIFKFPRSGGDPVVISAFFWFVISLVMVYVSWAVVAVVIKKRIRKNKISIDDSGNEGKPHVSPVH